MDEERLNQIARIVMRLRNLGVDNVQVLGALEHISRADFVEEADIPAAYDEVMLPLPGGHHIPSPVLVGILAYILQLNKRHSVLEVGTGSGFQAAVLSRLCRRVFTIERDRNLYVRADEIFQRLELNNIINRHGDGSRGWPANTHFDRIIINAATNAVHPKFFEQLSPGGFILVPLGLEKMGQRLYKVSRNAAGEEYSESLLESQYAPLVEDHSAA